MHTRVALHARVVPFIRLALPVLLLLAVSLACAAVDRLPGMGPTPTPSLSPTATLPPPTPTPTSSPTPTPTPTPLPAARIDTGDRARFYGDWDLAAQEYNAALTGSSDPEVQSAALLGLGRTRYLAGDANGSLEVLNQLLTQYPQSAHVPYAHFALAQALSALDRPSEAADAYLNYLIQRPGLIDPYVLNLRGDALRLANRPGEALVDYRAALQNPAFLSTTALQIKIGQTHAAVGDYGTALGIYQEIYNAASSDFTKAQMDLLMGQAYTAQGQWEQAVQVYQDAINNYPTSYDSYNALVALVEAGVPVDELNRGIVDYYAGQYGAASAALDRYLLAGGPDPAAAQYYYGLSLRAVGGYGEAVSRWDQVIQGFAEHRFWDDAWEQKAYTQWAFQGSYPAAVETLLGFVAAAPAHPRAAEFLYDAALVADLDEQYAQAAALFERVAAEYPNDERAMRSLFLAGVTRYRIDDTATAYTLFQRHLENAVDMQQRTAAYLWMGKCRLAQGDPAGAAAAWELAASLDPTGYYSERARDLLMQREPFTPPQQFDLSADLPSERQQAETWLRASFNLPPETDLSSPGPLGSDPRYIRGLELWELGLYDDAVVEFNNLRLTVQSDPASSYRLANTMLELGVYRQAILSARQVLNLAGMGDADTLGAPRYFNHIRFGSYFSELVAPVAVEYNFHPLLLYSVIRQESAFEGFVRSSAGARGLMQIIPATGEEIASSLGWPPGYSSEDLYRPLVSIRLGAAYLARWRDHFGGSQSQPPPVSLYAALAAYNGGPGNAIAWEKLANGDPDLYLEVVRFEETRNYIRGIFEIFSIYRRLYDRTP